MSFLAKKVPGGELMVIDDVVANLPFIICRDHRIMAAIARKQPAIDWAQLRSFNDEPRFTCIRPKRSLTSFRTGKR